MAQQDINIGPANQGQGDTLFDAFTKVQANFDQLFTDDDNDVNEVTGSGGITASPTTGDVVVSITDGGVTNAKMAANSVDSDQYVDGSIDTVHLANDVVTYEKLGVEFTSTEALGSISGSQALDFNNDQIVTATVSGATDFTYSNAKVGTVKDLIINADGNSFSLPTGTKIIAGTPTTGINFIQGVVTAAGEYWTSISQQQ